MVEEQKNDHLECFALVVEEQNDHLECSAWWAVLWVGLVGCALALTVLETAEACLGEEGAAQTEFGDEARGAGREEKELVRMGQFSGETDGFFW